VKYSIVLLTVIVTSTIAKQPLFTNKKEIIERGGNVTQITDDWHYTPAPFAFKQEPEWFCKISGAYVLELENASIYSHHGIVLCDKQIYQDSLWAWSPLYKSPHDIFPLPSIEYCDKTVATIALEGWNNYYHWMTEILPRIHLLQQTNAKYDLLYIAPLNYHYQKDTLELLGVNLEKIIIAEPKTHIQPKKLIFPSQTARSCVIPLWVIEFLQNTLLKNYEVKDGKKRIFISREDSSIRHIINEDEVFTVLEPFGFEKVYMEQLPVIEQAQLIRESEYIVGTHGAGMTNILFAQKGTIVIELLQELVDECFCDLCRTAELEYHGIKTERIPNLSQEHIDVRYRNTFIDIDHFKKDLMTLFKGLILK